MPKTPGRISCFWSGGLRAHACRLSSWRAFFAPSEAVSQKKFACQRDQHQRDQRQRNQPQRNQRQRDQPYKCSILALRIPWDQTGGGLSSAGSSIPHHLLHMAQDGCDGVGRRRLGIDPQQGFGAGDAHQHPGVGFQQELDAVQVFDRRYPEPRNACRRLSQSRECLLFLRGRQVQGPAGCKTAARSGGAVQPPARPGFCRDGPSVRPAGGKSGCRRAPAGAP